MPCNLEEFENLGGASIPSLMVTRIADQLRTKETTLLMSSFGLELSWGGHVDEDKTDGGFTISNIEIKVIK